MAISTTLNARFASKQTNLKPSLVLVIDGVEPIGSTEVKVPIRIGDPGLFINNYLGDPWKIGGLRAIAGQLPYISFSGGSGTTTRISQQLDPDKGLGTSITSMTIAMIDKNELITELVSPGFVIPEALGRSARVYLGFEDTAFPKDYFTIFKGVIEDISAGPGLVELTLSSTEKKKNQTIFIQASGKITAPISDSGAVTSITLDDASGFKVPVLGPDGLYDSSIEFYCRINDEFFRYTGRSGNTLTGVTRNPSPFNFGQQAHNVDDTCSMVVRLQGNGLDLARKIMLSGLNGPYRSGQQVTNFLRTNPITLIPNALYFDQIDLEEDWGIFAGDYISTSGAANGANNVTLKQVESIVKTNEGSYAVISGVSFVEETGTAALVDFRSKWDTLGSGCSMGSDDVDLKEIEALYRQFLSNFPFDFRLTEGVDAREFIEQQLMRPMSAFSVQRKGKVSVGFHKAAIPGVEILSIEDRNVENASKLKVRRSLSKNFYNSIIWKVDQDVRSGEFTFTKEYDDPTSIARFNNQRSSMTVEAEGIRTNTNGLIRANSSSQRFLTRYKNATQYIDGVQVQFGDAITVEIGDTVRLVGSSLHLSDFYSGSRNGEDRLLQVLNKTVDIKNGTVTFHLVDTNANINARYGLISPASRIKTVSSASQFIIEPLVPSIYGPNEYLKWQRFGRINVRIVSRDHVTRDATRQILQVVGNTVILSSPLPFTPQPGDIMKFTNYNNTSNQQKLVYAAMTNNATFDDGGPQYLMV